MYKKFGTGFKLLWFSFIIYMMLATLLLPQNAVEGTARGLKLCYEKLLPSIFPFMVFSCIAITSPFAKYLGILLIPYTKLLGIKSPKASTSILMGLLGGFASGAQSVNILYESNDITASEAELLLCCTIMSGPAFVIGAVGYGIFGNSALGTSLFAAQCISSLICGFACKLFIKQKPSATTCFTSNSKSSLSSHIQNSIFAMLSLCGTVVFFSCAQSLLPISSSPLAQFLLCSISEVTSACNAAAQCTSPSFFACAALSVMGASVYLQVRGLCSKDISILPLMFSRVLHLPVMLILFYLIEKIFPSPISVYAQNTVFKPHFKMPADACLVLIVFLACVCTDICAKKHLLTCKKRI